MKPEMMLMDTKCPVCNWPKSQHREGVLCPKGVSIATAAKLLKVILENHSAWEEYRGQVGKHMAVYIDDQAGSGHNDYAIKANSKDRSILMCSGSITLLHNPGPPSLEHPYAEPWEVHTWDGSADGGLGDNVFYGHYNSLDTAVRAIALLPAKDELNDLIEGFYQEQE
jgi:hypothetical protein